jgi:sulfur relay (sulfurtransferase) complex TusBCD TusD component (DsrE family)
MVSFCIFITSGPYTHERPYTALRFAYTALQDDNKVKIFFVEDGIFCLKKNQNPANIYNIGEWVQKCLAEEDCEIAACGVCMKGRGVDQSELFEKIKVGTMELAVQWAKECDKTITF